jgi:hypothetical protein
MKHVITVKGKAFGETPVTARIEFELDGFSRYEAARVRRDTAAGVMMALSVSPLNCPLATLKVSGVR